MGLDMYLYAKRYVSEYSEDTKEVSKQLQEITKGVRGEMGNLQYIVTEAMYWRKANAIHNWFVKNVQYGIDDCREYNVPIEKLQELLTVIKTCIKKPKKIPELLPPTSGFFFGSAEIDGYFIDSLKRTRDRLIYLIEQSHGGYIWEFSYRSSW